jgi:hypothetical protein
MSDDVPDMTTCTYWQQQNCVCCHVELLTQYCAGGKIEKNEIEGACGGCGGGERCAQGSGGET